MSESVDPPAEAMEPVAVPVPREAAVDVSKGSALWREIKGLALVLLAVLAFHSFIAKPFYIPSESMMPGLLKGDRLVVSKYAYGWSYVSPTIPNPAAIVRTYILRHPEEPLGVTLPFMQGRLFGHLPRRGDVAIVTPPGKDSDYIKRVIGLPGDTIEVRGGRLILNGTPVKAEPRPPIVVPIDPNVSCGEDSNPSRRNPLMMQYIRTAPDGRSSCVLPVVRETLPGGVTYDTIDMGQSIGDDYGPETVPAGHVFMMGDNRDGSADSRFPIAEDGLGGPVPWENLGGRAEFLTFSLDGSASWYNPLSWFRSLRSGRAGNSLRPQSR